MWQENVIHAALATGTREFLWWRPGEQRYDKYDAYEERPIGLGFGFGSRGMISMMRMKRETEHAPPYGRTRTVQWQCDGMLYCGGRRRRPTVVLIEVSLLFRFL